MANRFSREEQKYFLDRIERVADEKKTAIAKEYAKEDISTARKYELIATKQVELQMPALEDLIERPWIYLLACYDFTPFMEEPNTDGLKEKRKEDVNVGARYLSDMLMSNADGARSFFLSEFEAFTRRKY